MLLPAERARLASARELVRAYMLAHHTASNAELWRVGGNAATRRLWELRPEFAQLGYVLTKQHAGRSRWVYTLSRATGEPVQSTLWEGRQT